MDFQDVIDFSKRGDHYYGQVPAEWRQGRTAYGGATVAAAVRALSREAPTDRPLRYFNAQFVSLVGPGELELRTSFLAQGGNVSSGQAVMFSEGQACLQLTAVFAKSRFSSVPLERERIRLRNPQELPIMPYVEGVMPRFTREIEYRTETDLPFSGSSIPRVAGYCRHKTGAGSPEEEVIGLLDAWPPSVLPLLGAPSPASTVSWSAHIYDVPTVDPDEYWYYSAEAGDFRDGYASAQAKLYAPSGELVAWSEQLVAVYEKAPVSN